ncbi:MAG: hypothetical protein ACRDOU_27415 [Streptosporangiaceae bacterium]
MYGYAFNTQRRSRTPDPVIVSTLAWLERASLPVSQLNDPRVIRAALDGICTRLDGPPGRVSAACGPFSLMVAGVGFEPTKA